jgi:hypothetical protein
MTIFPKTVTFAVSALLAMAFLLATGAAAAGEWEISSSAAGELRIFPIEPAYPDQDDATFSPSISIEPEIVYEWNDGDDRLTVQPFARFDAYDENRTHFDLREANWLRIGDGWDLVVGIGKVFWGVTESRHLVDIVNQTDLVEDIDGEDKLGQPMISLNLERDWGALGLFVLPGFRERTFPDDEARLRGPLPIDGDNSTYESGAEAGHVDFALRWTHVISDWDIGLSYFRGTSREPLLISGIGAGGRPVLVPHYDQIDQTGLDVQLTTGAWLWKLEAMTRGGHGDRFMAAVGGFEHTFFQIGGGNADLGLLAEYLYDGRDAAAPATSADDDVFLGARLTLNDPQDSMLLAGAVVDRSTRATSLSVEAERRLGDSWKLELEGRLFFGVPPEDVLFGIRDDDHVTLRLTRFF